MTRPFLPAGTRRDQAVMTYLTVVDLHTIRTIAHARKVSVARMVAEAVRAYLSAQEHGGGTTVVPEGIGSTTSLAMEVAGEVYRLLVLRGVVIQTGDQVGGQLELPDQPDNVLDFIRDFDVG